MTRYMYGVTYLPADLQLAAQEAARGEAQPTINKFLKFCFSYDPAGRKYVLNTTAIGATVIILAALVFVFALTRRGPQDQVRGGRMSTHASTAQPSYLVDTGTRKGLMAWLTSTDHKRIGLLYLYAMASFFLVGHGHRLRHAPGAADDVPAPDHRQDLQRPVHGPRRDHDLPLRDPRAARRLRELLPAHPHRRQGCGLPAPEPGLLVLLHGRGRSWRCCRSSPAAARRIRAGPSTPPSA